MFVISIIFLIVSPHVISTLLGWDGLGLVSYLYLYTYFAIILNSELCEDLPFLYKPVTCHDENLLYKQKEFVDLLL
jgi:hypothetical protein